MINVIFSTDNDEVWLIDFDFAGTIDEKYPSDYFSGLFERHSRALPGKKRAKIHDIFAVEQIANDCFPFLRLNVCTGTIDPCDAMDAMMRILEENL